MRNLVAAVFLLAAVPALADDATLSVSGTGQVQAAPDMAVLTMGAEAQAQTASDALAETSRVVATLLDTLTSAGVEMDDIQTSGVSVRPVWTRPQNGNEAPRVDGFSASNSVTISVRDLDRLGDVISAATQHGANTLGGLSFDLQDRTELEDEARRLAVADALRKADVLAYAAGVELGSLMSLQEGGMGGGPVPVMRMSAESAPSVPVAAGQLTVSALVSVVFELED